MKKTILPILMAIVGLIGILSVFAFTGKSEESVEQYCQLVATGKLFSNKVSIDVDQGEGRKFISFKNTSVKDEEGKIKNFTGVVDAINYMGQNGWTLVNAYPITTGSSNVYHFYFKRSVLKSDLLAVTANNQ
jgi:hypothetical protein